MLVIPQYVRIELTYVVGVKIAEISFSLPSSLFPDNRYTNFHQCSSFHEFSSLAKSLHSRPCSSFQHNMQSSRPARKPKLPNWSPSHVVVFIRNLKLLQLDQREDWPAINARTLSPSPQNHRQRVKAVEWALYQLLAIWDPAGTQLVSGSAYSLTRFHQSLTLSRNYDRSSRHWNKCNR